MQGWVVAGAWIFAVLFAAVLLTFALYEITWKARRLQKDGTRLAALLAELSTISGQLQSAVARGRAGTTSPSDSAAS